MDIIAPKYQPISDVRWVVRKACETQNIKPLSERRIHKVLHDALCNGLLVAIGNRHGRSHHSDENKIIRHIPIPKELWELYSVDRFEIYVTQRNPFREDPEREYGAFYADIRLETQAITDFFFPKGTMPKPVQKKGAELNTKEKNTLLKLVIGLVVNNFGRNYTISAIKSDLDLEGINLDEDTIRKWVNQAKEFLPPVEDKPKKTG